jgi:molecular chaperone GrpE
LASHKNHKDHEDPKSGFAAAAGRAEDSARNAGAADAPAGGEAGAAGNGSAAEQLQKLLAEKQELMNTLVRRQADFENYRKRVEKERHQDRHRGVEGLIEQLLPVLDAFDRALVGHDDPANADYRKGFEMIRGQLWSALAKQGLERIQSVGKEFDPHLHHAIESVETADHAEGVVLGEMQPGYMFHGRVLRPAMVRVSAAPAN